MRQSSSSIPPTSSVSFFEKYEKMFHCGGCIADDEQEPVASAILYEQSRYGHEERNQSTEAISNWSSYIRERRQQESTPPIGTVLLMNQTTSSSFDELDKFDIEERKPKREQAKTSKAQAKAKAHTEATAVNEYFNGRRNSHQPAIQMAMQISSTTTITQRRQQQQQQHCPSTPLNYSNTSTMKSTCSSSSPKSTKRLHYDMLKEMLLANNYNYRSSKGNSRYLDSNSLTQTDSDLTQSTRSMSESDDDDDEDFSLDHSSHLITPEEEEEQQQQQEILVSILRRTMKLDTRTDTKTTDPNRVRRVVRFEQETKFPDPNERPSSTRKHVPRMSSRQKQEYRMMHTYYPPTTDRQRQRQLDVSSLLMATAAAAGPSPLVIVPQNNHDEFRDSSMTATKNSPTNMMCSSSSHQERLARRAQQNQYQPHCHHQRSHSSATAEEILLSHYYTPNNQ